MKSAFNISAVLLLFLLAGGLPARVGAQPASGKQEFTKTIKKEFPLTADGTVAVVNKYGKVDVKTWNQERVKYEVTILVKAGSESRAQEVFDRIDVDFTAAPAFVKAETTIESARGFWSWTGNNTEFKINYEVFIPERANLEVSNKYGDVFIPRLGGRAELTIKYGNFRLEGISEDLEINLAYGSGTVLEAEDAHGEVAYSKLHIQKARDVSLTSKYSKITIEQVDELRTDSRYDAFTLGSVKTLTCDARYGNVEITSVENLTALSKYTDFFVEELLSRGDFDLQFGTVKIDNVSKHFTELDLVGKYTDFRIQLDRDAAFVLEASAQYAGIRYPAGLEVTYQQERSTSHEVRGYRGQQNAPAVIKASLSYGGLRIR